MKSYLYRTSELPKKSQEVLDVKDYRVRKILNLVNQKRTTRQNL